MTAESAGGLGRSSQGSSGSRGCSPPLDAARRPPSQAQRGGRLSAQSHQQAVHHVASGHRDATVLWSIAGAPCVARALALALPLPTPDSDLPSSALRRLYRARFGCFSGAVALSTHPMDRLLTRAVTSDQALIALTSPLVAAPSSLPRGRRGVLGWPCSRRAFGNPPCAGSSVCAGRQRRSTPPPCFPA